MRDPHLPIATPIKHTKGNTNSVYSNCQLLPFDDNLIIPFPLRRGWEFVATHLLRGGCTRIVPKGRVAEVKQRQFAKIEGIINPL